jgi:prevent-host-death family protein
MKRKARTVAAGRFKAECLSLLSRVAETGETYVVTKRGRPVAQVVPVTRNVRPRPLRGSVTIHGDIVGPALDTWDVDK